MAILEAVFANKAGQTPQEVERRRRMAQALVEAGSGGKPPSSGLELAGRLAMTLTGQYQAGKAERQDAANRAAANSLLTKTLLGDDPYSPTPGATGSSMPKVDASGNVQMPPTGKEWETIGPRLTSDLAKDFQLSPEQAAGVVGQLGQESAGFGSLQEKSPMVPGSRGGYGYAQWTGPRRKAFEAWSQQNGLDPTSYEANYGFLKNELANTPEGAVIADIRNAPDAMTAGRVFTDKFLRPGIPNYDSRDAWTKRALAFTNAPVEVASLDPVAGMPARAPTQGPTQAAPPLPPPTTIASAPQVASVPQQPPSLVGSPVPGQQPASPQVIAQASPNKRAQIAALLQNPYTQEMGQQMLMEEYQRQQDAQNIILKQQVQQSDPKYQTELQKSQIELQNLREPKMSPAEEATNAREQEKMKFEREKFDAEMQKGQWQKLTDGRLYNQTTGEFRDAPPPMPGSVTPKFDDISGMRKEIQQLPSYKNLAAAAPIYKAMAETAGRNTKASDLNLVYGLGKIMDPTSVVREGEMIMVKNTASLPDWLQGAIASLNGGAALTPETRQAIMTEAYGRVKGYNDEFQQNMGQYQGIVQRNGINPADVIPEIDKFEPWKAPEAPAAPTIGNDWQELSPGVRIRKKAP